MRTLKIFISLALFTTAFAGAFLEYFQARSEGDNIRIEWRTQEESNLKHFVIERKNPQTSYIDVTTILPKGSNSYYVYVDENVYKSNDLIFIYRLKIVDNNGQISYSNEITVSHSVSGVKRTWGSIKAMFR